jgi:hypothetical protein
LQLKELRPEHTVGMLVAADAADLPHVRRAALRMTRATFDETGLWAAAPFVHAPLPLLRAVLGDDDLRTDDESRVLAVVLRWLRYRGSCDAGTRIWPWTKQQSS